MKEQILEKLLKYLQGTEDFLLEQMPDVIQQTLKYQRLSGILTASLMLILIFMSACVCLYNWKHPILDKYESRTLGSVFGIFIPGFIIIPLFIQLCYSIDFLLKIYISPKYYLIQLFMNMAKG